MDQIVLGACRECGAPAQHIAGGTTRHVPLGEFDEHTIIERLDAITHFACLRTFGEPAYTEREQGAIGAYRTVAADHGWILSEDTEAHRWTARPAQAS